MLAIGIDAATSSGFAVIERPGGRGKERLIEQAIVPAEADLIAAMADKWRGKVSLVAIEEPYLDRNPETFRVLAEIAGRWRQEFERGSGGCSVVMTKADVWQKGILSGLITGQSKRAQRKLACQMWVKAWFGLSLPIDICDAIGLATHELRRRSLVS